MILLELYLAFAKIGLFTFGGGYAMLPLIERDIIHARGWLTLSEFTDIVAIAEVTPGPVAINSATFVGYRTGGILGGVLATLGVVTPSLVIMLILAALSQRLAGSPGLSKVKNGMRPAVAGLIAVAALSVAKVSLQDYRSLAIAAAAALLVFKVKLHPIAVLAISAVLGVILY